MLLKVLIVNKDTSTRKKIESLLANRFPALKIIASIENLNEARMIIESEDIDLLFLNIMIGNRTAFELLNSLKKRLFKVILTTMNESFAICMLKYASLDYLLEPIDEADFNRAIECVNKRATIDFKKRLEYLMQAVKLPESLSRVALTTGRNEIEFVNVNHIIYCEAEGFYTTFHMENQSDILVCKNLKEYEKILPDQFVRIHKSYLINKNRIKKISRADGGYIVMDNEKVLPIGRKKEQYIKILME